MQPFSTLLLILLPENYACYQTSSLYQWLLEFVLGVPTKKAKKRRIGIIPK
jgi:hypothetical protein